MNEKIVTIQAARGNVATVHLAEDRQPLRPLCKELPGRYIAADDTANCTPCVKEARRRCLDVDGLVRITSRVWNLINAVKSHARANYNEGAWDLIVEAYSDNELAELVQPCRTAKGAIAKVAKALAPYRDRRAYHDAEIAAATDQPEPVAPAKPDSVIRWTGSDETEWYGIETWPGKVGHNDIDPNEGTRYVSGFHLSITSPGACDHKPGGWPHCDQKACRHADCVNVPF